MASISDSGPVPSWTSRLCAAEIMKCSTSRHWLYTAGFVQHCCLVSLEMELYECKTPKASLVSNFATTINNLWPLKQIPPASPIVNVGVWHCQTYAHFLPSRKRKKNPITPSCTVKLTRAACSQHISHGPLFFFFFLDCEEGIAICQLLFPFFFVRD